MDASEPGSRGRKFAGHAIHTRSLASLRSSSPPALHPHPLIRSSAFQPPIPGRWTPVVEESQCSYCSSKQRMRTQAPSLPILQVARSSPGHRPQLRRPALTTVLTRGAAPDSVAAGQAADFPSPRAPAAPFPPLPDPRAREGFRRTPSRSPERGRDAGLHLLQVRARPRHAACRFDRRYRRAVPAGRGGARVDPSVPVRPRRNYNKSFRRPRRPYEKERLDSELKVLGEYGLRNKRELWRVQAALSKIRKAARTMLTMDEKDTKRIFEGNALLRRRGPCRAPEGRARLPRAAGARGAGGAPRDGRGPARCRLTRYGLLPEDKKELDYVLSLKLEDFLNRRLQTIVWKLGLAKSVHHARVLIKQGHIRVGKQIVNVPSFLVRVDSERHIDFSLTSPFGGGRPGRVKRKSQKAKVRAVAARCPGRAEHRRAGRRHCRCCARVATAGTGAAARQSTCANVRHCVPAGRRR